MLGYFLVCLALGSQTIALPADPPSTPPSTTPPSTTPRSPTPSSPITTNTTTDCKPLSDCEPCLAVPGCVFVKYEEVTAVCQSSSADVSSDPVSPKVFIKSCDGTGEDPNIPTTTTTPSDTTTDPKTTTTISTTGTTTSNTTTTSTTPTTTPITTTPIPDTTIPTTPTTTTATTVTTTTSTTTTTPTPSTSSTEAPEPEPDTGKGHFDGWSFFGGILLTLGLAAIGLVGFKYYRLRSGTGGNYNRF